jgi:RimJ/RimL family protein N-acetyltransferase
MTDEELLESEHWVAVERGAAIGFISIAQYTDWEYHLLRYGTSPSSRCKGLGAKLVKAALRYIRPRVKRVTTYVLWHNVASLRCLVRCGFEPYKTPGDWSLWLEKKW